MQETWVWSLGWEDPLEKEMATHSTILAWRIPWTEEPGGLQNMGSQRVGHDLATKQQQTFLCVFSTVEGEFLKDPPYHTFNIWVWVRNQGFRWQRRSGQPESMCALCKWFEGKWAFEGRADWAQLAQVQAQELLPKVCGWTQKLSNHPSYGDTHRNQTIHVNSPPPQNNPHLLLVCQKVILGFPISWKNSLWKNLNELFGQPNTLAQTKYLITLFIIWEQVLINKKIAKIRKQLCGETKSLGYSTAPPDHILHSLLLGLSMGFHWATLHWCALWIQMLIAHPHHTSSSFFLPIALSWKKKNSHLRNESDF